MIIIGAGLAGAMARGFFSSYSPQIYESRTSPEVAHKAIMHFKDYSIGYLIGAPLEKVQVLKAIYYRGNFVQPNFVMSNLYSRKVSKGIFSRSIASVGTVERFITKSNITIPSANYGKILERINEGKCYFKDGTEVSYDACISTIPLPRIAKIAGLSIEGISFDSWPICVTRYPIKVPSDVFQTVYYPDLDVSTYRVSLERQVLIVESLGSNAPALQEEGILGAFSLEERDLGEPEIAIQSMGKIVGIDDNVRRQIILELTKKFNIYSLGRYAIWKNITSEVLLKDLELIARMINLSSTRDYSLKLEGAR